MLEASAALILERIGPDAVVLDVGGAARPFVRADWVLDLLPYEARGQIGWDAERAQEHFGPRTWVRQALGRGLRSAAPLAGRRIGRARWG